MISHRLLSNEVCGNGLRDRVTACRKRLRDNRVAQKAPVHNDSEAIVSEAAPVSRFRDYVSGNPATRSTMTASVVHVNSRCSAAGAEPAESETLLSVAEEVGIT
jgi:hypothetical protein